MFSLNFMFFCSLIEELCTKEENYKTSCNFNFGHECILKKVTDLFYPLFLAYCCKINGINAYLQPENSIHLDFLSSKRFVAVETAYSKGARIKLYTKECVS